MVGEGYPGRDSEAVRCGGMARALETIKVDRVISACGIPKVA